MPDLRKTLRQCNRYMLISGVVLPPLCYFTSGLGLTVLATVLLALMIYQIPFLLWINIRRSKRFGVCYEINVKGIQVNQRFYSWQQVEEYNFSASPLEPDVENVNVKVRQSRYWKCLPFCPEEVTQQELSVLLERFAPTIPV